MAQTKVSDEVAAARTAICRDCPNYRPISDQCRICGCAGMIAQRTQSIFATCPEDRWNATTDQGN